MATQATQTVYNGATILIKIKGQVIGRIQSISSRVSFGTEGVYEIGSIMPQEHVQNRYEGSITIERYAMKNADLARLGLLSLGEDILTQGILDVEVIDKLTGKCVTVYRGCTAQDYSSNHRTNAISGENATFVYLSADNGEA